MTCPTKKKFTQLQLTETMKISKNSKFELKSAASTSSTNMVSNPNHYGGDQVYEVIKVIEAWDCNFNIGNAVKYLGRYKKKFNPTEDLKKAIWYIQREIMKIELEGAFEKWLADNLKNGKIKKLENFYIFDDRKVSKYELQLKFQQLLKR